MNESLNAAWNDGGAHDTGWRAPDDVPCHRNSALASALAGVASSNAAGRVAEDYTPPPLAAIRMTFIPARAILLDPPMARQGVIVVDEIEPRPDG